MYEYSNWVYSEKWIKREPQENRKLIRAPLCWSVTTGYIPDLQQPYRDEMVPHFMDVETEV